MVCTGHAACTSTQSAPRRNAPCLLPPPLGEVAERERGRRGSDGFAAQVDVGPSQSASLTPSPGRGGRLSETSAAPHVPGCAARPNAYRQAHHDAPLHPIRLRTDVGRCLPPRSGEGGRASARSDEGLGGRGRRSVQATQHALRCKPAPRRNGQPGASGPSSAPAGHLPPAAGEGFLRREPVRMRPGAAGFRVHDVRPCILIRRREASPLLFSLLLSLFTSPPHPPSCFLPDFVLS